MKLVLKGHDERYVVEQGMLNLFPGERPVYEPIGPEDNAWAKANPDETQQCYIMTPFYTAPAGRPPGGG